VSTKGTSAEGTEKSKKGGEGEYQRVVGQVEETPCTRTGQREKNDGIEKGKTESQEQGSLKEGFSPAEGIRKERGAKSKSKGKSLLGRASKGNSILRGEGETQKRGLSPCEKSAKKKKEKKNIRRPRLKSTSKQRKGGTARKFA